jgi:YVTN family beta-propeller protein
MKILSLNLRLIAALLVLCCTAGLSSQVAGAQTGPFVYVSNPSDGSVTVIDSSTNTISAVISLCVNCGPNPAGLAVTPGGKFVYVAEKGNGGAVAVIDTTTNTVTATIALPPVGCELCTPSAAGVAITPDGTRAYVTDTGQSAIHVIDIASKTVTTSITAGVDALVGPIAVTPDGSAAFYTFGSALVGRIDTNPSDGPGAPYNTRTTTIGVGNGPTGVAITPDSTFIYVATHDDNAVSVIPNNATFTPVTTVSLGTGAAPFDVAITPNGKTAYVSSEGGNASVFAIDTATKAVVTATANCSPLSQLAITSDSSKVYVADEECNSIDVISTGTNTETATISNLVNGEFTTSPFGVAIAASQTKTLSGPPGTTYTFTFNTDTYKITPITNVGTEIITVEAFLVNASNFPAIPGFTNEKCIPYGDYSSGGVDTCVEFQVHCQKSATNLDACDFIYLVATGYDLPTDLSGGIGGPDFLVAHLVDCALTNTSVVQSIFLSYDAGVKDPTTRGGSRGPSCFVATYTPGAPVISGGGTTSRFSGWGSPVVDGALNQVKAGSTRPLSFQFFDTLGHPITNLSLCTSFTTVNGINTCQDAPAVPTPWVNLTSYGIACPNGAPINPSTDTALTSSGGSSLQNLGGGSYQFNWKTQKTWKGACANVVVTFDSTLTVVPATLGFQFN